MTSPREPDRRTVVEAADIVRAFGWNRRSSSMVAAIAASRGIDPAALASAVASVLTERTGSAPAGADPGRPPPPAGPEAEPRPSIRVPWTALAVASLAAAAVLSVLLVRAAIDRSLASRAPAPSVAARVAPATPAVPDAAPGGAAGAPEDQAPRREAPRAAPVPAMYPRPPGFGQRRAAPWARSALEAFCGEEPELLALQARLLRGEVADDADRAAWGRATDAFRLAWPLLERHRCTAAIVAIARTLPLLGDTERRDALRSALRDGHGDDDALAADLWRASAGAGLEAACASASAPGEEFRAAATAVLGSRAAQVAEVVGGGDPAAAADVLDAWLRGLAAGVEAAAAGNERRLALLEMMLRSSAPMHLPGVAADAAGEVIGAIEWSGDPSDRARIADAFKRWLSDPAIDPRALHGLTSVFSARQPGQWWDPWLVVDARSSDAARQESADRWATRLAMAAGEPAAVARRPAGPGEDAVRAARSAIRSIDGAAASTDLTARLDRVARLLVVVEGLRLSERGRSEEGDARLRQAADGLGRPVGPGAAPPSIRHSPDGRLAQRLRSGDVDDALAALRDLRRDAPRDLGAEDAAALALAAFASPSPQVRAQARAAVVASLAEGPMVVKALVEQGLVGSETEELVGLAEALTGQPVPDGTAAGRRAGAQLALEDLEASLRPTVGVSLDGPAGEIALAAGSIAAAFGAPAAVDRLPERALRRWFDAAMADAVQWLPLRLTQSIAAAADARRRLAVPGPQAAAVEAASILELDAAVAAERDPSARESIDAILREASVARASAPDAVAQLETSVRAIAGLAVGGAGSR